MKKLLLFSVLSIFLFSCSSDDDTAPESTLAGTWKMTSFEVENSYDFNQDGTASRDLIAETNCYQNETIQMNEDGSGLAISNSYLFVVADLVVGTTDQFTYTLNCELDNDTFPITWTSNGSTLSFTEVEDSEVISATIISDNQFSIVIPEGFGLYSGGSFNAVTEEDVTVIYTRQ